MKLNFSEDEIETLREISTRGTGTHLLKISNDLGFYDYYDLYDFVKEFIPKFEQERFIKSNRFLLDKEGYAEDFFIYSYKKLIKNNKINEAKELTKICNLEIFNKLGHEGLPIEEFKKIHPFEGDRSISFGGDLCSCLLIEIEVFENLINFMSFFKNEDSISEEYVIEAPKKRVYFDGIKSVISINNKTCNIRKYSKQYDFLRVLFSDIHKDWQFSEIAQMVDQFGDLNWKRLHNHALAIGTKITVQTGIKDFFITTTQSIIINPKYTKEDVSSDLDEF